MGLLDELRQRAAIISGEQENDAARLARNAEDVEKALRRGYSFFLELASYLNIIKPENKRSYVIPRLGSIEGMYQSDFFVDYRTTLGLDNRRLDYFYVRYTSSADRVIERQVDFMAAEKLRTVLWESHVEFTQQDARNEQERVVSGSFQVPCRIRSELIFKGDYPSGLIIVACRNVDWLGRDEFLYDSEEIQLSLLEDYVRFIFGEQNTVRQHGRHQGKV